MWAQAFLERKAALSRPQQATTAPAVESLQGLCSEQRAFLQRKAAFKVSKRAAPAHFCTGGLRSRLLRTLLSGRRLRAMDGPMLFKHVSKTTV